MTSDDCTNENRFCDCCGRPICKRCSRCFERYARLGHRPPPSWSYRCPSRLCRLLKWLDPRPLRRGDTPRTGVCTDE